MWRLDSSRALVVTADFITPLVDDARSWGRIAAANSISDVYAMGGRPILALNLVGWTAELPSSLLGEVLAGADEVAAAAGYLTVGGHTIDDPEPKYGLAVVGEVHPQAVLTNAGLRPGDALVLTKPLGTGVVSTAVKQDAAPLETVEAATATMAATNDRAAAAAREAGATGATDVTGFGLFGHLGQMAEASGVDVTVDPEAVRLLPGVRDLAAAGMVAGGTRRNLEWARERVDPGGADELTLLLLADAQTSGGLVFGAEPSRAASAATELTRAGVDAAVIGRAEEGTGRMRLS